MTTSIYVHTSGPSAVLTASEPGWSWLRLDLSGWSTEERTMLASMVRDGGVGTHVPREIDVAPPTAERLLEIVTCRIRDEEERVLAIARSTGRMAYIDIENRRVHVHETRDDP